MNKMPVSTASAACAAVLSALVGAVGPCWAAGPTETKPNLLDSNNYACAGFVEHRENGQGTVMLVHFGVQFNSKTLTVKFIDNLEKTGKPNTQEYPIRDKVDPRLLTFGEPPHKEAYNGIMYDFINVGTLVPGPNSRASFSAFIMGTNVPAQQAIFNAIDGTCIPYSMLTMKR
jgi:hypothetical protein